MAPSSDLIVRIPLSEMLSMLAVVVVAGLLVVGLVRFRRQGSPGFLLLTFSLLLWQIGKLGSSMSIPGWQHPDTVLWGRISFIGATLVYPSFFFLALQVTLGRLRRHRLAIVVAFGSAALLVWALLGGWFAGGGRLAPHAWFHRAPQAFVLYTSVYAAYMVAGMRVLWKGNARGAVSQPSRILFWAAAGGLLLGALEFIGIPLRRDPPLSNLAPVVYSGVFYWAIYRFNYLGGRRFLRQWLLRAVLSVVVFLLVFLALLVAQWASPWFEHPWMGAFLVALLGVAASPMLGRVWQGLRSRWFPVQHGSGPLLLSIASRLNHLEREEEMYSATSEEIARHLGLSAKGRIRKDQDPALVERLDHVVSRRALLTRLRLMEGAGSAGRKQAVRAWRILRRAEADIALPVRGPDGAIAVLLFLEERHHADDWSAEAQLLEGAAQLLAGQIHVRRMLAERDRERHLGELGLMAAGLAHEIKNPLEGIFGAAQILQEEGKGNPRFVGMVLRDSMRLNDVVHAFLRYARPWKAELKKSDPAPWIEEYAREQESHGIHSHCRIEGTPLPIVRWDVGGMQQVLLNLFQNAARVQPPAIPIRFTARSQEREGRQGLAILVEDDGPGMTPEQEKHLFEPFHSTVPGGNGIGLAVSRKIVRAMGGELSYSRATSGGALFTIWIPSVT